jgi:hypothetical protein
VAVVGVPLHQGHRLALAQAAVLNKRLVQQLVQVVEQEGVEGCLIQGVQGLASQSQVPLQGRRVVLGSRQGTQAGG